MLSADHNELYTRVGPATPVGNLLRRYWYPVAALSDFEKKWTKRIRLLGENLVLFKDRAGRFGLLEEQCPHRRASLAYGIPTHEGIRCPYHGWHLDRLGRCVDQPNEPRPDALKGKELTTAYAVEELGGMLWAYMGPLPAPILPRFAGFVADNAIRMLGRALVPTNWLQIMENSVDPIHTEWLHGHHFEFMNEKDKVEVPLRRHHLKIAFDEFEFGIVKRRLLEGQSEDSDDWRIGHPVVFPNMLSVGNGNPQSQSYNFQIRVPVDDTQTLHLWYTTYILPEGKTVPPNLRELCVYDVPIRDETGELIVDYIDGGDIMAWVTQGAIADRSRESLGTTDAGIVQFRRMLEREIDKVARGEDPIGVLRDPTRNGPIELPVERNKHHFSDGFGARIRRTHARYAPINEQVIALFDSAPAGR
jgi:5,5'-dehydrodivanillate O-demethylase oxygenase subunit